MKTPLKRGDSGPDVRELQNLLVQRGFATAVDGIFGEETLVAVMDFQSKHKDGQGRPLKVDGIVGPLTLASLQTVPVPDDEPARFLGFDAATYPGDETMRVWAKSSPYRFVGYYLDSPCHRHFQPAWTGHRDALVQMGWGLAAIYVGQQIPKHCRQSELTRDQGLIDATDAIQKAAAQGFEPQSVVFLDIEPMDTAPPEMLQYLKGWISQIISSDHVPGIYCHRKNADALRAAALAEYPSNSPKPEPVFWITGGKGFDPSTSVPPDSEIPYATIWQGKLDFNETHGGIQLGIDASVSTTGNPSGLFVPLQRIAVPTD
jgi:hypothetical protein